MLAKADSTSSLSPISEHQPSSESNTASPAVDRPEECIIFNNYTLFPEKKYGLSSQIEGIYKPSPTGLEQKISAKIIEASKKAEFLAHEGQTYATLKQYPHPHITSLRNTLDLPDGRLALVMDEYGMDLHTHMRFYGRVPEPRARYILYQLAQAVSHLHSLRIVLRDLKLGRIFFKDSSKQDILIGDLELSQPVSYPDYLLNDQKGSPAYVAPEVLNSTSPYDGAPADVWALGVIFYVLLTASYPFQENVPALMVQKIQASPRSLQFPSSVSEKAKQFICRILNREACSRPTAAQLVSELCHYPSEILRIPLSAISAVVLENESCDDDHVVPSAKKTCVSKLPDTLPSAAISEQALSFTTYVSHDETATEPSAEEAETSAAILDSLAPVELSVPADEEVVEAKKETRLRKEIRKDSPHIRAKSTNHPLTLRLRPSLVIDCNAPSAPPTLASPAIGSISAMPIPQSLGTVTFRTSASSNSLSSLASSADFSQSSVPSDVASSSTATSASQSCSPVHSRSSSRASSPPASVADVCHTSQGSAAIMDDLRNISNSQQDEGSAPYKPVKRPRDGGHRRSKSVNVLTSIQ